MRNRTRFLNFSEERQKELIEKSSPKYEDPIEEFEDFLNKMYPSYRINGVLDLTASEVIWEMARDVYREHFLGWLNSMQDRYIAYPVPKTDTDEYEIYDVEAILLELDLAEDVNKGGLE